MSRLFRHASRLAALVLTPWILCGQTDPALWRFIHPNAQALISINWKLLRQSQVGATLRDKWLAPGSPAAQMPGMEFLNDIDRLLISSFRNKESGETTEAPVLVVAAGRFDAVKVRAFLVAQGMKPQQFNAYQVYRPQGKNTRDLGIVLFDPQTVLIGDARSIFASLERNAYPQAAPEPGSLMARAAEMETNYDIWIVGNDLEALASDRLSGMLGDTDLASEIRGFQAGVALRMGLAAEVDLRFETESSAKAIVADLTKFFKLSLQGRSVDPAFLELQKKLNISADGPVARINLRLTPQELERNTRMIASLRTEPGRVNIRPVVTESAPEPPKPQRKTIRIEGLDDGPREILMK